MIVGIGIDLVEVGRIEASLKRFGDRFMQRILRLEEIAYCQLHKHPGTHVAARFAAKEAFAKAFGTFIGHQLGLLDIEVVHQPSGQPAILLHAAGQNLMIHRQIKRIQLSLSHTNQYATAVAILEG